MGVQLMTQNSKQLNNLVDEYGRVRNCISCSTGLMIPSKTTLSREYKGNTLEIKNFPVFQCLNCAEEVYGTGDLINFLREAKKQFDTSGCVVFDFDNM